MSKDRVKQLAIKVGVATLGVASLALIAAVMLLKPETTHGDLDKTDKE